MARKKPPELLPGTLDPMILKTLAVGPNQGYGKLALGFRWSSASSVK